ncbi:MAG: DUF4826 family protein [Fimbriimonas sp.]
MSELDYDDPEVEIQWCEETLAGVRRYLEGEGVRFGEIAEWPAWHIAPYVSIWAVESGEIPDALGWWVIAGDLPSDYLPGHEADDPREAMRLFSLRWQRLVDAWEREQEPGDTIVGSPSDHPTLMPLLRPRAKMLMEWVVDDDLWEEE